MFTSGTTGAPKGVMCTNGQTVRAFNDWSSIVGLSAQDRYLIINPFFHAFGYKAGLVASLTKGCAMITQAVFDVGAAVESIEREKVSMIPGPPTLYQTILANPDVDFERLSTLRLAVTGAAVVPVELINRMRTDLGFETVITGYGLTEACGVAAMCRHDDSDELISRSSGRAIPGVEIQVVDDSGKELPRGETGELVIRGFAEELFRRLPPDAVAGPERADWGATDAAKAAHWSQRTAAYHGIVTWSPTIDPERLKLLSQEICIERGVKLVYHGWASEPLMMDGRVAGISFESKEGRMAIRARVCLLYTSPSPRD